jgi:ribonuclease P protein component
MRNIDSLKKEAEFRRIYEVHDSLADSKLVIYKAPGSGKLGIVCSKKIGNSVVRHRFSRLVREAYRLHREELGNQYDIIVIAREGAKGQGFFEIERSFLTLLKRHSVFQANEESK